MTRYIVDCASVTDLTSFVRVMNDGFIHHIGGSWNGGLDAFNDYLSWPDAVYDLVLLNTGHLSRTLGTMKRGDRLVWDVLLETFEENREYCAVTVSSDP